MGERKDLSDFERGQTPKQSTLLAAAFVSTYRKHGPEKEIRSTHGRATAARGLIDARGEWLWPGSSASTRGTAAC